MSAITLKYVVKLQLIHFYLHALHYLFQMEGIIKPVEDVLKVEDGTTMKETIRVKIVDVVPVYNYKKKDNTTHSMFAAAIADEKTAAKLLVYDVSKAATMKAGTSWFLMDFVVREG